MPQSIVPSLRTPHCEHDRCAVRCRQLLVVDRRCRTERRSSISAQGGHPSDLNTVASRADEEVFVRRERVAVAVHATAGELKAVELLFERWRGEAAPVTRRRGVRRRRKAPTRRATSAAPGTTAAAVASVRSAIRNSARGGASHACVTHARVAPNAHMDASAPPPPFLLCHNTNTHAPRDEDVAST